MGQITTVPGGLGTVDSAHVASLGVNRSMGTNLCWVPMSTSTWHYRNGIDKTRWGRQQKKCMNCDVKTWSRLSISRRHQPNIAVGRINCTGAIGKAPSDKLPRHEGRLLAVFLCRGDRGDSGARSQRTTPPSAKLYCVSSAWAAE